MKNLLFAVRPLAMDLISTLVFVVLTAVTHNAILATGVAMAAGVGRLAWLRIRGEPINAMQLMSLALVVVFGGATLITHNARFMMFKPTIVYVLIGASMLQRGWMLAYMPPAGRGRVDEKVMIGWGHVWAGLMFATAALNAGFALFAGVAVWSGFITVFPLVSKIVLFAAQFLSIRHIAIRHYRAEQAAQAVSADLPLAA